VKKPEPDNARLAAVRTLSNVLDRNLNLSEADASQRLADPRDQALSRHLSYGVLRWLSSLEWLGTQLISRPLKSRDRDILLLIWLGLFQLWKDDRAHHAAVNETAECARLTGKPWAVGLVNAVLRRFQREQETLISKLSEIPQRFAHPPWLLQLLQVDWPGDWQGIVMENNQAAPLWLRLNRNHPGRQAIAKQLEAAKFSIRQHPFAGDALELTPSAAVDDIPGFREGVLSVQDPAAQLAADLLMLEEGQRVLDACAAPGGKTCHILERFPSTVLTAVELNPARLQRVRENVERLGFTNRQSVRLVAADVADTAGWWDGQPFDRILLDAPCSATGVIRRHPEIKWLRTPEQLAEVALLQGRLLKRLWPLLAPGGILVYATCSVLKCENFDPPEQFLSAHDDAVPLPIEAPWGLELGCGRQILPGEEGMDGFFYARLRKTV